MTKRKMLFFCFIISTCFLVVVPSAQSQNWASLPPYNILWPLWSPILSPVNATTQLPTPIVSSLNRFTLLPYQPAIAWDPYMPYPWFLYNSPFGIVYYDVLQDALSMWPPLHLINPFTFEPLPIALPSNYSAFPPVSSIFLSEYVPLANEAFTDQYFPNAFLLTAIQLVAPF
ncbi:MAG: hypothetical protein ACMUIS_09745 [bacterium]